MNFDQHERNDGEAQCELSADPGDAGVDDFCHFVLLKVGTNGASNASASVRFDSGEDKASVVARIETMLIKENETIKTTFKMEGARLRDSSIR